MTRYLRFLLQAVSAALFAVLSFFVWRIAYQWTDWAALALLPFAFVLAYGTWSLTMESWRAQLHLIVRPKSGLAKLLSGKIRAFFISAVFTLIAITVLAWKALDASMLEALVMCTAFLLSAYVLSVLQIIFSRHFHPPFDRNIAVSVATWLSAMLVFVVFFVLYWAVKLSPGELFAAENLTDVIGLEQNSLPARSGWVTALMSALASYENLKLWLVVQLRDYLVSGVFYSLDAALWAYVLCRSAVVSTHLIKTKVFGSVMGEQDAQAE